MTENNKEKIQNSENNRTKIHYKLGNKEIYAWFNPKTSTFTEFTDQGKLRSWLIKELSITENKEWYQIMWKKGKEGEWRRLYFTPKELLNQKLNQEDNKYESKWSFAKMNDEHKLFTLNYLCWLRKEQEKTEERNAIEKTIDVLRDKYRSEQTIETSEAQ
ncbi:protein of unknown function [endosymbiont DhMRE of Dentiscutata heterogama]|uniref:hypothetical protein n=1 Tax=endosymbiont DhMRE of Dentiscutata heterogama TaxID=1609546 RepID=UPI000629DCD1|nr:hypothetical protein [endosymbiont DhMRE of Dentiscutata heterogama]CFW93373.1 protein of unknown function [endosymbiont DhMRE of Dentiscutata heterogama]